VEAHPSIAQPAKVALGRFGSFGLERTNQAKIALVNILPAPFAKEVRSRGNSWAVQTEIDTNDLTVGNKLDIGHGDNHMQPEAIITPDQVSGVHIASAVFGGVTRQLEGHGHAARCGREPHASGQPVELVGVNVVSCRAQLRLWAMSFASRFQPSKSGLDHLSRLNPSLNQQVGNQAGANSFGISVGQVMQTNAVLLAGRPTNSAHMIERLRELTQRFSQCLRLHIGWLKLKTNRSLHTDIMPYPHPRYKRGVPLRLFYGNHQSICTGT
jgi:hypothetical protein